MDDKEVKVFARLCDCLADPSKYYLTKVDDYAFDLLGKLIDLPVERVFPCLDLYRIFLLHPDMTTHFKKFEDGASRVYSMLSVLHNKDAGDPAKMLACRCLVNMFKDQSAIYILREKRQKVIEALSPHLMNPKATIRESAITVILNFSIQFLMKDDPEGKIQCLSALSSLAPQKASLDEQSKKRIDVAVTNLTFKHQEGKELAAGLGLM